jgi:hypothetical protein
MGVVPGMSQGHFVDRLEIVSDLRFFDTTFLYSYIMHIMEFLMVKKQLGISHLLAF